MSREALASGVGSGEAIPLGSTFEHAHNGIMRVLAPDGHEILWANDKEALPYRFPESTTIPSSVIHYLPKESFVSTPENYVAGVFTWNGLVNTTIMNVTEAAWYDEQNPATTQTFPQAICIDGQYSVGATSRGQLLLSEPLTGSTTGSANGGSIPVFSVEKFVEPGETETKYFIGTLSVLGSTNAEDTRKIWIQKDRVDPNQPIGFNIITGNGAQGGTNVFVTAQANLTTLGDGLHYTVTATSSMIIQEMDITPRIWRQEPSGDVLVYTGPTEVCTGRATCVATGNYTPTDDKKYFANATVLYTVPVTTSNGVAAGTQQYTIATVKAGTATSNQATDIDGHDWVQYPIQLIPYPNYMTDASMVQKGLGYSAGVKNADNPDTIRDYIKGRLSNRHPADHFQP